MSGYGLLMFQEVVVPSSSGLSSLTGVLVPEDGIMVV